MFEIFSLISSVCSLILFAFAFPFALCERELCQLIEFFLNYQQHKVDISGKYF